MSAAGLRAKAVRGYRAKANIHHLYPRHPKPALGMSVTAPNQAWVGDISGLGTPSRLRRSRYRVARLPHTSING
jgi:hypothetical protein